MKIQIVYKGIGGIDGTVAREILTRTGIVCNWWRHPNSQVDPETIQDKLSEENLLKHLEDYSTFCQETPFISTTAGAVERDTVMSRIIVHDPLLTAIAYATDNYSREGYVFYGYVFTLGKIATELPGFAEERRDPYIDPSHLYRYHPEGEITAKLYIPSICLSKFEKYEPSVQDQIKNSEEPVPLCTITNPCYVPPERYANIYGVVR